MFRRREDEMNDADTSGQGSLLGGSDTVKVLTPESSGYTPSQTSSHAAPGVPSYGSPTPARNPSQDASPRPVSASSFRNSQPQADIGRPRAPEGKPASSFPTSPPQSASANHRDSRRVLTVGSDILLKGEIATCDRLVIEGKVDATLNDVGTVELAEAGSFKGIAQVENAEISGLFEGELIVKGRLVVYASGRVRGKVTYGEIEIERGGELTGEIKTMAAGGTTTRNARNALKDEKEKASAAA